MPRHVSSYVPPRTCHSSFLWRGIIVRSSSDDYVLFRIASLGVVVVVRAWLARMRLARIVHGAPVVVGGVSTTYARCAP